MFVAGKTLVVVGQALFVAGGAVTSFFGGDAGEGDTERRLPPGDTAAVTSALRSAAAAAAAQSTAPTAVSALGSASGPRCLGVVAADTTEEAADRKSCCSLADAYDVNEPDLSVECMPCNGAGALEAGALEAWCAPIERVGQGPRGRLPGKHCRCSSKSGCFLVGSKAHSSSSHAVLGWLLGGGHRGQQ